MTSLPADRRAHRGLHLCAPATPGPAASAWQAPSARGCLQSCSWPPSSAGRPDLSSVAAIGKPPAKVRSISLGRPPAARQQRQCAEVACVCASVRIPWCAVAWPRLLPQGGAGTDCVHAWPQWTTFIGVSGPPGWPLSVSLLLPQTLTRQCACSCEQQVQRHSVHWLLFLALTAADQWHTCSIPF